MKRSIAIIIIFIGVQIICSLMGLLWVNHSSLISGISFDNNSLNSNLTVLGISLLSSSLLTVGILWLLGWIRFFERFRKSISILLYTCMILILFPVIFLTNLFAEFLSLPDWTQQQFQGMSSNGWCILSMVVIAPISEEYIFRAGILRAFIRQNYAPWKAIIISSILFALIHMNPNQIVAAFVLGILFGWLYTRSCNIWLAIIAHMINNSLGVVSMYVVESNKKTTLIESLGGGTSLFLAVLASFVVAGLLAWYVNRNLPAHHFS